MEIGNREIAKKVSLMSDLKVSDVVDAKFIPPRRSPLLTRLIQSIFYLVTYFVYRLKLVISDRDVAQLKEISHHRVVYLPNHSNLDDGLVMFLLSARLGQLFYYVVAHEAFQGRIGKLMQLVGSYSIRRGVGDRSSIMQTLKILQQPESKLVIFPEGGCSYQNDTVIPFRTGGIELAFKAIEKLTKQEANFTVPDFYLVPVSLKYTYPNATDKRIAKTLTGLETALSIQPQGNGFYLRLRAICAQLLNNLESEYGVKPRDENDWNHRIKTLKQHLIQYCEEKLNVTTGTGLSNRERIYKVQAILRSLDNAAKHPSINYQHLTQTTVRLLNFDAIYDGYVAAKPTPERFFATLDRLEREVYKIDRPKFKGLRRVEVKTGTPINLKDYYQNISGDKSEDMANLNSNLNVINANKDFSPQEIINGLTREIEQVVQTNLIK